MFKYLSFLFLIFIPTFISALDQDALAPVKIGVITPLTGGVAVWGQSVRAAIEIANQDSKTPAELFFQDEETCSPTKALSAYQHLVFVEKVQVLVASCLEGAQAIAPLALRDQIPFFISGRSSGDFQLKNPNATSWLSLLDYEGLAISKLIHTKKWQRGVALVWDGYFGVQFAASIDKAIAKDQLDFNLKTIELNANAVPNATEVQALLRLKPEVIFIMTSEPTATFFIRQLRSFGYKGEIIIQSSMLQTYDEQGRKVFIDSLQQKFFVDELQFNKLQSKIKESQGENVADDFIFSYDGFSLLLNKTVECQLESKSISECLTPKIRTEDWQAGVSGKFRIMKDGSTERPMLFKRVTATGFEPVS